MNLSEAANNLFEQMHSNYFKNNPTVRVDFIRREDSSNPFFSSRPIASPASQHLPNFPASSPLEEPPREGEFDKINELSNNNPRSVGLENWSVPSEREIYIQFLEEELAKAENRRKTQSANIDSMFQILIFFSFSILIFFSFSSYP